MRRQATRLAFLSSLLLVLAVSVCAADTRRYTAAAPAPGPIALTNSANTDPTDNTTATARTLAGYNSQCTTNCAHAVAIVIRANPDAAVSCTANGQGPVTGAVQWDRQNNVGQYCAMYKGQTGAFDVACSWAGGTARTSLIHVRSFSNVDQSDSVKDLDLIKSTGVTSSSVSVDLAVATDLMVDFLHVDNTNTGTGTTGQTVDFNTAFTGAPNQFFWGSRLQGVGTLTSTVTWADTDPRVHCAYLLREAP